MQIVKRVNATTRPEHRNVIAYLGADVAEWREGAAVIGLSKGRSLKEASYLWQTHSYIIWPAAARQLLANLPIDLPIDNFISRAVLHGEIRALVAQPFLARQASPYYNGDIVHSRAAPQRSKASKAEEAEAVESAADEGATTHNELQALPGVGAKLALALAAHSKAVGGFRSADQLLDVPGIGSRRAAALQKVLQLAPLSNGLQVCS